MKSSITYGTTENYDWAIKFLFLFVFHRIEYSLIINCYTISFIYQLQHRIVINCNICKNNFYNIWVYLWGNRSIESTNDFVLWCYILLIDLYFGYFVPSTDCFNHDSWKFAICWFFSQDWMCLNHKLPD